MIILTYIRSLCSSFYSSISIVYPPVAIRTNKWWYIVIFTYIKEYNPFFYITIVNFNYSTFWICSQVNPVPNLIWIGYGYTCKPFIIYIILNHIIMSMDYLVLFFLLLLSILDMLLQLSLPLQILCTLHKPYTIYLY